MRCSLHRSLQQCSQRSSGCPQQCQGRSPPPAVQSWTGRGPPAEPDPGLSAERWHSARQRQGQFFGQLKNSQYCKMHPLKRASLVSHSICIQTTPWQVQLRNRDLCNTFQAFLEAMSLRCSKAEQLTSKLAGGSLEPKTSLKMAASLLNSLSVRTSISSAVKG